MVQYREILRLHSLGYSQRSNTSISLFISLGKRRSRDSFNELICISAICHTIWLGYYNGYKIIS